MTDNTSSWVVLELSSKAENEDPDTIKASIRHHIRDAEVFIPASVVQKDSIREYHYLVDGYAFIKHKHPDSHYTRLEDTKYVVKPLRTGNRREKKLSTVSDRDIDVMRSQIAVEVDQGIETGDRVVVTSGPYKHITAIVQEEIPEQDLVVVHVELRSTDRLVSLPRAFLRLDQKSPLAQYRERFEHLFRWSRSAKAIIAWPNNRLQVLQEPWGLYRLFLRHQEITDNLAACKKKLSLKPILARWEAHELLTRGVQLVRHIAVVSSPVPDIGGVLELSAYYDRLLSWQEKIEQIQTDMNQIVNENMPNNLVVDGTQLFIRCAEAPGLGSLTDSQGRPTGAIVGFLKSLSAYKKRFKCDIYVCWDGSSQRRKAMYPDYKGNRPSRSGEVHFGWLWLKELLPLLGVRQAYNPVEEADDVMATLVSGPLKNSRNLMITSDRDLLQAVSESTHQLCPASGTGKEKVYDPALVKADYGVVAPLMVQLRALSGDTSDHIPGVPGFGPKTASKVIQAYGGVDALLRSNFAGLTKGQVANLRASADQIKLNVSLMTLRDVEITEISENPDKEEADNRLKQLDVKSEPILAAFFPKR